MALFKHGCRAVDVAALRCELPRRWVYLRQLALSLDSVDQHLDPTADDHAEANWHKDDARARIADHRESAKGSERNQAEDEHDQPLARGPEILALHSSSPVLFIVELARNEDHAPTF